MFRLGLKAGVIASAVYFTVDSGVWKDSETTTELYYKIKGEVTPYVKPVVDLVPFELPKIPKTGDMCSSAKTAWNKGVMASCLFLSNFCDKAWDTTCDGIKYSYNKIRELLEPPEETKS
ncbi:UNVERIFIED_CONTAM: hypothetical protein PYX00_008343 [Menopon gallinae]|uniref:MICOS complex subunit MIC13 n=1 Tax=Menopon gallinae TaxID=328185 RepID=A0AAW2HMX3_9NEOP